MSREIATFRDRNVSPDALILTSFWGGKKDKKCLQFSIEMKNVQLTKSNVIILRDRLDDWLQT